MWTLFLAHHGLLLPIWLGGALWLGARRRWLRALVPAALVVLWVAALVGWGPGVEPDAQWAAVALLGLRLHRAERANLALALPLVLVGLGPAAALAGVVLVSTGALAEPGRGWLAVGLAGLAGAGIWDEHSLSLWLLAMRWLGLGMDPASALVDGGEQLLRVGAWICLLRWAER